jgi:hypothetical protein
MQNGTTERWLPLAEAAVELGISTDTARRRLRKQQLVGEQRPTPQGFTWWVCLGAAAQVAPSPMQPAQAPLSGLVELVELVDRLQRENRDLAGLVGSLQERNANLEAQLALPAPTPSKIAHTSDSEGSTSEPTGEPSNPKHAWWRFWS